MDPVIGLCLGRIVLGVLSLVDPRLAAKLMQLDPESDHLTLMTRMFGIREIAIGGLTLLSSGRARTALVGAGVAIDAADTAVAASAGNDGTVSRSTSALFAGVAGAATLIGIRSLVYAARHRTGRVVSVDPAPVLDAAA